MSFFVNMFTKGKRSKPETLPKRGEFCSLASRPDPNNELAWKVVAEGIIEGDSMYFDKISSYLSSHSRKSRDSRVSHSSPSWSRKRRSTNSRSTSLNRGSWENWKPTRVVDLPECGECDSEIVTSCHIGGVGPRPLEGTPGYSSLLPLSLTSSLFSTAPCEIDNLSPVEEGTHGRCSSHCCESSGYGDGSEVKSRRR